jgi:hypothetical protein
MSSLVLSHMTEWIAVDKLVLNLDKADKIQFVTNYLPHSSLSNGYDETVNT